MIANNITPGKRQQLRLLCWPQRAFRQQQTSLIGRNLRCLIVLFFWLQCNHEKTIANAAATAAVATPANQSKTAAAADTPSTATLLTSGNLASTELLEAQSTLATSFGQQQQQQQTSGCDLLFTAGDNLASYCQCKDVELLPDSGIELLLAQRNSRQQQTKINQLSCAPQNFGQFIEDLSTLQSTSLFANTSGDFQVDYLEISANLTVPSKMAARHQTIDQRQPTATLKSLATTSQHKRSRLIIDHISLQLAASEKNTIATTTGTATNDESQTTTLAANAEQQMIDFVGLINEPHLQFLSIFLEDKSSDVASSWAGSGRRWSSGQPGAQIQMQPAGRDHSKRQPQQQSGKEIKFARLLAKLSGLSRLELSLGPSESFGPLKLEAEIFRLQSRLKWLNLASNRRVEFGQDVVLDKRSPFVYCSSNLEFLSLESSSLERFPLFSLFLVPFKLKNQGKTLYGLPSLTSLNLAANKLQSFESDLFAHFSHKDNMNNINNSGDDQEPSVTTLCDSSVKSTDDKHSKVFVLIALTQLDLSNNKLSDLTFKVGQYLLCTMPNLNQLYLQRNKIVHLNLNSLLSYPFLAPASIYRTNEVRVRSHSLPADDNVNEAATLRQHSRLEYIDLSHNKLLKITAFHHTKAAASSPSSSQVAPAAVPSNQVRVKSINLSHNNLRLPVSSLDSQLISTVLFKETFDGFGDRRISRSLNESNFEQLSLGDLEELFQLVSTTNSDAMTICDFLSPASSSSADSDADLLNEVIFTNNKLDSLSGREFSSKQCKDIQILRLLSNRIASIAEDALVALQNLEEIDLSQNSLTNLMERTFIQNVRLRVLNLSRNRINFLNRNTFLHLLELEELLLNDNELFGLPSELFLRNNRLSFIDLSKNKLTHLDGSTFSDLKQLRILNLRHNQLKKFSYLMFDLLENNNSPVYSSNSSISLATNTNLISTTRQTASQNVRMSGSAMGRKYNNIKSSNKYNRRQNRQAIEASNVLIMASNLIESFHFEECVQFAQSAQLLWLNDNQLKELTLATFKCLPNAQRLYLQANRIRSIHESTFSLMRQLEYLDLSGNQLSRIQPTSFAYSGVLRHVDLSFNNLIRLDLIEAFCLKRNDNNELVQVESINLSENPKLKIDLSDLSAFLFSHISIRMLNMGNIGQIQAQNSFTSTRNANSPTSVDKLYLESFNLSAIHFVDDRLFISLLNESNSIVTVEKLDLSSINISHERSLTKMRSFISNRIAANELSDLNLGNNQFGNEQLEQLLNNFTDQTHLISLKLTANNIEHWPFNTKSARKLSKLRSLDLSRNKLRYFIRNEIDSYEFPELETLNLSSNILIGLIEYQAHQMKKLGELTPKLKNLDLSYNRLTWIPAQFFANLNELSWLKLDHNQLETMPSVITNHRLILDLSFNYKLHSSGNEATTQHNDSLDSNYNELILVDISLTVTGDQAQIECHPIEEYIILQEMFVAPGGVSDTFKDFSSQIRADNQDEDRISSERCHKLLNSIDSLRLNSVSSSINLNTIGGFGSRFVHLSLNNNGLTEVRTNGERRSRNNIIMLDLGHNRIQNLPKSTCKDLDELRSLDLSNNQLRSYPSEALLSCETLNYLDLSSNKISTLTGSSENFTGNMVANSQLLVLKLYNNILTNLNGLNLNSFKSLRFIDLRSNQLKSDSLLPLLGNSIWHTVVSDHGHSINYRNHHRHDERPFLKLHNDSLAIVWAPNTTDETKDMLKIDTNNRNLAVYSENNKIFIKLCTLDPQSLTRLCFKSAPNSIHDHNESTTTNRCFYVKSPKNTSSCLTNLIIEPKGFGHNSTTADQSQLTNLQIKERNTIDSARLLNNQSDPILSFIDALKVNWLKLKQVDVNEYLSSISNIRSDSIWIEINGKYRIQMLTILKVVIVGGSICIVGLLIAVFKSLTDQPSSQHEHLSPKSNSELTNISNETEASNSSLTNSKSMSCNGSSALQSKTDMAQTNPTCYSMNSRSNSSSRDDTTNPQTVMEKKVVHQLDANQLLSQQQQQRQACSTPSSSSAPSSVETAETMQAIDSIQSGSSNLHFGYGNMISNVVSVDQYAENQGECENLQQQQQQQHSAQKVATVMRMVKSSSANFDYSTNRLPVQNNANHSYGTLNPRYSNYSTLKSKLRAIQERQQFKQQQIYPYPQEQPPPLDGYYNPMEQQQHQYSYNNSIYQYLPTEPTQSQCGLTHVTAGQGNETSHHVNQTTGQTLADQPNTMSLLSVSTGLSGTNTLGSQQVSPSTTPGDQLCHYHRLVRDPSEPIVSGAILEQEEEHYQGNDLILMGSLPPPPPSSRAIEALENPSMLNHHLPYA